MGLEKTPVNANIDKSLYAECKIEAIRRDITLAEFMTNALNFYIKESSKIENKSNIDIS